MKFSENSLKLVPMFNSHSKVAEDVYSLLFLIKLVIVLIQSHLSRHCQMTLQHSRVLSTTHQHLIHYIHWLQPTLHKWQTDLVGLKCGLGEPQLLVHDRQEVLTRPHPIGLLVPSGRQGVRCLQDPAQNCLYLQQAYIYIQIRSAIWTHECT